MSSGANEGSGVGFLAILVVLIAIVLLKLRTQEGTATSASSSAPAASGASSVFGKKGGPAGKQSDLASVDSYPSHASFSVARSSLPPYAVRPDIYFGLKVTKGPQLTTGIMWRGESSGNQYRHEPSGDMDEFYWTRSDGRSFGDQYVNDTRGAVEISTSFYVNSKEGSIERKKEYEFSQRIVATKVAKMATDKASSNEILLYFGIECSEPKLKQAACIRKGFEFTGIIEVDADSKSDRMFHLISRSRVKDEEWNVDVVVVQDANPEKGYKEDSKGGSSTVSWSGVSGVDCWAGADRLKSESERPAHKKVAKEEPEALFTSTGLLNNKIPEFASFAALQVRSTSKSFAVTSFHYESIIADSIESASEQMYDIGPDIVVEVLAKLEEKRQKFDLDFERSFPLDSSTYSNDDKSVAKRALSSVIGGIGLFNGFPVVGNAIDVDQETKSSGFEPSEVTNRLDTSPVSSKVSVTLFTGTPSRTAFPRGFLWDEGFHQLLVSSFDVDLSMAVVASWLDAMFVSNLSHEHSQPIGGWIPREMILGEAAKRRVPAEFLTQRVNIANPPTLILVVEKLVRKVSNSASLKSEEDKRILQFLYQAYPALHAWLSWFDATQAGPVVGSYRWRGRSSSDKKFIPNTLASGLDDFPRSPFVSAEERHLDLHCWMTKAALVMSRLQELLSRSESSSSSETALVGNTAIYDTKYFNYSSRYEFLSGKLNEIHWSDKLSAFADVGLYHDNLAWEKKILFRCENPKDKSQADYPISMALLQMAQMKAQKGEAPPSVCPKKHPSPMYPMGDGNGGYVYHESVIVHPDAYKSMDEDEDKDKESSSNDDISGDGDRDVYSVLSVRHIPRLGYVNLFPLLLRLINPSDSSKLSAVLNLMSEEDALLTPYGLRSIAKKDAYYRRKNAPGDEPYWRGPIWININYLALGSLKAYSKNELVEPDIRGRCGLLYSSLRERVVRNILGNFHRTGHLWEQYDDVSGSGIRGKPFTGWTALVANVMAESYD